MDGKSLLLAMLILVVVTMIMVLSVVIRKSMSW